MNELHLICKQHKHGHYHTLLDKLIISCEDNLRDIINARKMGEHFPSLDEDLVKGRLEILHLLKYDLEFRMVE